MTYRSAFDGRPPAGHAPTIFFPFGENEQDAHLPLPDVMRWRCLPFGCTSPMSPSSSDSSCVRKAIQRPSSDQSGYAASRLQGVMRRSPFPSVPTMKIACRCLCGSYRWNAKRVPSGDQIGE